jgi:D-glycero-D-manno-heptose 1,7-bisphosphate phosphatase
MIERAIRELGIDRGRSFLIGDKESDVEAARRAGLPARRYRGGRVDDLVGAVIFPA